jgi:hypothetical protein
MIPTTWLAAVSLAGAAAAQYFPPTPEGLTVVDSKHEKGVKISYKQVCGHRSLKRNIPMVARTCAEIPDYSRGSAKPHQELDRTRAMFTCRQAP